MAIAQLTSRIDAVKIYAAGATIARIAALRLTPDSLPEQVEIAGLPLALDDTSVRVRVEIDGGNVPIASDIRIGLAVPPPSETPNPPADEELRAAKAEVQRLEDIIALINNEIAVLSGLEVPNRPDGETGKAPPPSPMSARLALANFSDEQIRARMQEKRETLEMLRQAQENLAYLQLKQTLASTAKDARPNELRKTAIVSLTYEGEFNTEQQTQLVIEYFVPGARWTPTYVCRLDSANSTANIAVRALICQRTGEDWSGVRLELSTALPMTWCALPELPSLRLGKAQPVVRKTGWRRPPIGAEILFEDYDRQKKMALAGVRKESAIADFSAPFLPSLPSLLLRQSVSGVEVITHNRLPQTTNSKAGSTSLIALNFSPFGNKVVASGYVNPDQMHQAIIESRKSGRPLTEVLESLTGRQLPPELLRQYKKQQLFELKTLYGVEPLDTEINQIPTEQVNELIENLIPVDICRRYNLIPLAKNDTQPPSILVAMVNPDNLQALDDLNRILRPQGIELQRMVITMDDYQQLINGYLNELSDRSAAPPSSAAKPASAAPGFLRGRRQAKSAPAGQVSDQIQVLESFSFTQEHAIASNTEITEYSSNYIAYGLMQLGAANDKTKRGKLSLEQRNEVYLEILQRQKVVVNFDITQVIQQAVTTAESCLYSNLPPGGIKVREVAGSFDYAYSADGRLDVPSDGQFHSVALTNKTTNVDVRYIVVPREDTNVFRIAQLRNPLAAPLLSGSADVYVDGEYILSTNIATVPPKGKMEIGLGVEQAIKVARNTFYQESRAGTILVAFNEMQHKISIEIANRLSKEARIEVRERIPVPQENAKVDVQIDSVSPAWEKYEQEERGTPIRGGYRWRVKVPGGRKAILSADYTIKTYVDSEIVGGNRRE